MKYIAKRLAKDYEVSGIKECLTPDNKKVEVIIASKVYNKKELEKTIVSYSVERDGTIEKYNADIKDMQDMLDAINKAR